MSVSLIQLGFTPFILAGFTAFLFSFILVRSGRTKKYRNLPPRGPREWPVLGSLPSLAGKDMPHVILANMAKKYGPIFSMQMGSFYAVVLSDYSLIRQAFTKSNDEFSDRPKITMIENVVQGKGLIVSYFGQMQTEHRRFSLSALRSLGMGKFKMEETISDEARHLALSFSSRQAKPFVPFHDIVVSVSNIICWLSLGKRFDYDDESFQRILAAVFESFEIAELAGLFNFIPFLRFLPRSGYKRMLALKGTHDNFMKPMVLKVSEEQKKSRRSPTCFVEMYTEQMMEAERESPGKHTFTEDNMYRAVADLFAAGTETTATTLKWALMYMVLHRDVQEKIHKELDDVVGRNRLPRLTDRPNLPYTEATLLEIQRFASITPLGVPHAPVKDVVLNGYDIPKGTVILPNLWAIHHDPDLWKNPDEFNPDRFLDPETKQVVQREELIPFSIGRRRCMGEQLAKVELFIFFTHLLHRFKFETPEGAPPLTMKARNGATLNPEEFEICASLIDDIM
ncbi:cytochrome P450 2U1-like [Lytechinus variegatus]|uniref:cytochrome P450 2U1-like n=1 Tax=Lytechinus variegatus TaxID=7654 RepID=UPI001BB13E31|nr:cytochrome P450 2U1-like [Lytechinus variegatus]